MRLQEPLAGRHGAIERALAARFGADRDGYCEAKTGFVISVLGGPCPTAAELFVRRRRASEA